MTKFKSQQPIIKKDWWVFWEPEKFRARRIRQVERYQIKKGKRK